MQLSVKLSGISKRFGNVVANDDITISAQAGDVHAILGENGAGKTTLMKILAGLQRPDSGHIEINGEPCTFRSPRAAIRAGIGMVHQHFALVPALTVAENLALGRTHGGFLLKPRKWNRRLLAKSEETGLQIRPTAPVWQLSLGERQRVEIFRLILDGAKVLILDEPTSILAPQEAEVLFQHIRSFAEAGHVVFLVTHKIAHVQAVANKLTVLRQGRKMADGLVKNYSAQELASLMVGDGKGRTSRKSNTLEGCKSQRAPGQTLLRVSDLHVSPHSSTSGLRGVDLELQRGELLGVAGVGGNGQDELVAALAGLTRYTGNIDSNCTREHAFAHIPADRIGTGIAGTLSLKDNLVMRKYLQNGFSSGPFLRPRKLNNYAMERIRAYEIKPGVLSQPTRLLSGGNIQKVLLARELDGDPSVILAVNPTAGLDVATVALVHAELRKRSQKGAGVIIVSEDLDELLELCDRILVFYEGKVVGCFDASSADRGQIGLLMSHGTDSGDSSIPVPSSAGVAG